MTAADASLPTVVLDASVLINFLAIDRADLLRAHRSRFVVTTHVRGEIAAHYPEQVERLRAAFDAGTLSEIDVDGPPELETFGRLSETGRLGSGECSAIACAHHRGFVLAIDDRQARKQCARLNPELRLTDTPTLVLDLIRAAHLTIAQADAMLDAWATSHRFRLPFTSFKDALGS